MRTCLENAQCFVISERILKNSTRASHLFAAAVPAALWLDSRDMFREVLRNACIFNDTWNRTYPSCPTDAVIYTLEGPPVLQRGAVGRPRLYINEDVSLNLLSFGFTYCYYCNTLFNDARPDNYKS